MYMKKNEKNGKNEKTGRTGNERRKQTERHKNEGKKQTKSESYLLLKRRIDKRIFIFAYKTKYYFFRPEEKDPKIRRNPLLFVSPTL